jgi:2-keto-3-deoxy-L-fuconate dehydrogenase
MMGSRLAGKRVIVTDCNEYNGADIVELFKEEGATVFADNRDLIVRTAADDLIREVGHVDILIANLATKFEFAQARDQPDSEMERLMNSIFYPLHRLTRAVLPQMLERKRGKIVVVGSSAGVKGRKGGVALYGAARGAQFGYMRNLALEVAPLIQVNGTAQTYVDNQTYWPDAYRETEEFRQRLAEVPPAGSEPGESWLSLYCFWPDPRATFSTVTFCHSPEDGSRPKPRSAGA